MPMLVTNRWDEWRPGVRIDEGHGNGRWEIESVLQGGLGRVYIIFDHYLQCRLAMKGFQWEIWEQDRGAIEQRFKQEALAWVNVTAHPNVVKACFVENIGVTHKYSAGHPQAGQTLGGMYKPFLFL